MISAKPVATDHIGENNYYLFNGERIKGGPFLEYSIPFNGSIKELIGGGFYLREYLVREERKWVT